MSSSKIIILKSSDGETFEVEEAVALESQMLKYMIVDNDDPTITIPIPEVNTKILGRVIEYCKRHVEAAKGTKDFHNLKDFDANFVKVSRETLFDLIRAANYLNIKSLLDLTCQTVADLIKGKTPEEIYKFFNPPNTQEEEEKEEEEVNARAFE